MELYVIFFTTYPNFHETEFQLKSNVTFNLWSNSKQFIQPINPAILLEFILETTTNFITSILPTKIWWLVAKQER